MDLKEREWIREQVYEELSVRSKLMLISRMNLNAG